MVNIKYIDKEIEKVINEIKKENKDLEYNTFLTYVIRIDVNNKYLNVALDYEVLQKCPKNELRFLIDKEIKICLSILEEDNQ